MTITFSKAEFLETDVTFIALIELEYLLNVEVFIRIPFNISLMHFYHNKILMKQRLL